MSVGIHSAYVDSNVSMITVIYKLMLCFADLYPGIYNCEFYCINTVAKMTSFICCLFIYE